MAHPIFANYFDDVAKNLFEDLVDESIQVGGYDCYYLPREIDSKDKLLNEIFLANFKEAYKITVFREELGGFFPNDFLIQKFGPEFSGSNTVFAVSKRDFTNITGEAYPIEGALLIFTDEKQIYEVKNIDTRDPWISGGRMYYWKMSCLPFSRGKNHRFLDEVNDYIDTDSEELLGEFLDRTDLYSTEYFTADSICITADTTHHLASEDLREGYFLPVTADRTDINASDADWTIDIDWKGQPQSNVDEAKIPIIYPEFGNGAFGDEAKNYSVTNPFGFN